MQEQSNAAASINGLPIDRRVRRLVTVLNTFPGLHTFSSCGGHHQRLVISQVGANQFYVCFTVAYNSSGWRAIERILRCIDQFGNAVTLKPWLNGDEIAWQMDGRWVHPNTIAEALLDGDSQ